jgi:hypothetical protein
MKYSLRSLMILVFSLRDLLWLAVVVALLVCWRMDHWTLEYTHGLFMRLHEGEIHELEEMLKEARSSKSQPPAPKSP